MADLRDVRVLLGVTGGIAAYKAALVARLLVHEGAIVDTVFTRGAERFVGAATFEGLTGRRVRHEVWEDIPGDTHVALGRAADVALIYPATAHVLAKLAGGLADDLLTTTLLAATCPLVVAPAMHTEMWQHPATQANVALLADRGVTVAGPASGTLMGGDVGAGRVVEREDALAALRDALERAGPAAPGRTSRTADRETADGEAPAGDELAGDDLAGRTLVVSAGGTREPLDPVRFLGNRSTGKMGFAIAAAAARRGAEVHLVAANADLPTPDGVTRHDVTTALELREVVLDLAARADVVVKAAAVADFRPAAVAAGKIKKADGVPTIELARNPDILAELGAGTTVGELPLLVGFAAETDEPEQRGWDKLERKGADLLVVNDVSRTDAGFGTDTNHVLILGADRSRTEVELATKAVVADRILDAVVARLPDRPDRPDRPD